MKIKIISWLFLGLLAVIVLASCATAPAEPTPPPAATQAAPPATTPAPPSATQPTPTPPPPPPPPPPAGLNALSAEALAKLYSDTEDELNMARQAALDAGAGVYAPDFLLDADNAVALALQKYEANDYNGAKDSADEALLMYSAIKNGLDAYSLREEFAWKLEELAPEVLWQADDLALEMFDRWRAKDYAGAKDAADKALFAYETIDTGFAAYDARQSVVWSLETLAPDFLLRADDIALGAIDKWFAEDYDGAREDADKALLAYGGLKIGVEAYQLREEIALDALRIDPNALWQTDDVGWGAVDKWSAGDYLGAKEDAETAMFGYTVSGAAVQRQRALDARADVAVRQEFNAAQAIYDRANALSWQSYDEAVLLYTESLWRFRQVARTAEERRLSAEEALRRAERRLLESDETARSADAILEGGR